jgi:hypothetical protein
MNLQEALTPRWYQLRPHPIQHKLVTSKARFRVVPAGRRSGKTERAKRNLVRQALLEDRWPDARFFAAAPTRDQAKQIYWQDLKRLIPPWALAETPRESELMIRLVNGAEIWVVGMDKPERIEGRSWNGGCLDEYGNMRATAWTANIRPALADRGGWCWMIGTPEGRNHYYDLFRYALADESGEWAGFHWVSADILSPGEIEAARRDMDELTFQQEFEASFLSFAGRIYYPFEERTHCARLSHDPRAPLILCLDFNVDPGTAVIAQELRLPSGHDGTGVIGEVHIERSSNTERVCRKILADWGHHVGRVVCYGDATGGAAGSAKVAGSDWDIVRRLLGAHFKDRLALDIPPANPPERVRINSVNARLKNALGEVRLMVDPTKAPWTVRDLEGVRVIAGSDGEIDKKADPRLTHLSDALGYYVTRRFSIVGSGPRGPTRLHGVY